MVTKTMINKEKILICLPTFHSQSDWILRSVQSVQEQTHENFDCFLVKDSCSKCEVSCLECEKCRETDSICKSISKKDTRFKYFNLPIHCGGAGWGPRNFAILNSDHELIAYLDDDNWYEPNHIELLLLAIKENDADFAYTGTRLFNKKYEIVKERICCQPAKQGEIDTSEIMHKRWLINKYGGWRHVNKCNDWDMISRWDSKIKWAHTNTITLNFYMRNGCGVHRE